MTKLLIKQFDNSNHTVPYSELAMTMKIAGRHITYAHTEGRKATIQVDGNERHYTGLISELIPIELRGQE